MKTKKIPTVHCPHCNGSGRIPDASAIASSLREERIQSGVKLIAVADFMRMSKSRLWDLEQNRRGTFTDAEAIAYRDAIAALKDAKDKPKPSGKKAPKAKASSKKKRAAK